MQLGSMISVGFAAAGMDRTISARLSFIHRRYAESGLLGFRTCRVSSTAGGGG